MPEFEHQQTPEAASHGLAAERWSSMNLRTPPACEVAALEGAGLEQDHQHVFEFVAHPVDERERESLLLAIEHFARHADALGQLSAGCISAGGRAASMADGRPATHSTKT